MNQPEVLLLDEPTSGLDPLMQQEFFKIIAEVCEEGRTVLFSSHILSEVERACERVAIIREGRILMISSVAELKAKSVRRVEIAFDGVVPDGLFANLSEVRAIVQEDNRLYCIVQGSLDAMIKTLANHKVSDMISQEPSLEDIFLAFYNEDPHAA